LAKPWLSLSKSKRENSIRRVKPVAIPFTKSTNELNNYWYFGLLYCWFVNLFPCLFGFISIYPLLIIRPIAWRVLFIFLNGGAYSLHRKLSKNVTTKSSDWFTLVYPSQQFETNLPKVVSITMKLTLKTK
jgi:hypothetical protein